VADGPPDLKALVDRPAHAVEVPAEQRHAVLDELAVHEAHCRLVRQLLRSSLESRHNGTQTTAGVLSVKEAAAALGVTASYLRHQGGRFHVEMLAATADGFILPWSEGPPPPISTLTGIATALPFGSSAEGVVLTAVHAPLFQGVPAANRS
jgi:hypothetical protein